MNGALRYLLNLPPQGSTIAREVDWLHFVVILVTMLGATAVTVLAAYYTVKYRQPLADRISAERALPKPRKVESAPVWIELVIIVGLLALFVGWWVVGFRQYVAMRVPPEGALEVYVSAKQWMWTFAYPDGRSSNAVLYVPANRPIKLVMTSRDVIHSFFVPEFRLKQDVVPGRVTTMWFEATAPGRYQILCTEYCGASHSTMRGEVIALSAEDFERYLDGVRQPLAGPKDVEPAVVGDWPAEGLSLAAMGERVATDQGCLRCHTVDGTAHIGPTWAGLYRATIPLEGGSTVVADEAFLTQSMMDPNAHVHAGFAPVMPSYAGLLSVPETGALLEYMKSLRSPGDARQDPAPTEKQLEVKP